MRFSYRVFDAILGLVSDNDPMSFRQGAIRQLTWHPVSDTVELMENRKGLTPMSQFSVPPNIDPLKVNIVMIAEALPENPDDYFYGKSASLYVTNTVAAFNQAGIEVKNIADIIKKGVYLTVAVKAVRQGLTVPTVTIRQHSEALEQELMLFPNIKAILLMGDAAIKALNFISQRQTGAKTIPVGSTYKIRKGKFYLGDIRVFPSYLQTGKNFLIEKAKREMVAEDIRNAFDVVGRA